MPLIKCAHIDCTNSPQSFVFYSSGVYYEAQCGNTPDDLDHAVLAVGYGVDAAVEHIRARTVHVCDILLRVLLSNCG